MNTSPGKTMVDVRNGNATSTRLSAVSKRTRRMAEFNDRLLCQMCTKTEDSSDVVVNGSRVRNDRLCENVHDSRPRRKPATEGPEKTTVGCTDNGCKGPVAGKMSRRAVAGNGRPSLSAGVRDNISGNERAPCRRQSIRTEIANNGVEYCRKVCDLVNEFMERFGEVLTVNDKGVPMDKCPTHGPRENHRFCRRSAPHDHRSTDWETTADVPIVEVTNIPINTSEVKNTVRGSSWSQSTQTRSTENNLPDRRGVGTHEATTNINSRSSIRSNSRSVSWHSSVNQPKKSKESEIYWNYVRDKLRRMEQRTFVQQLRRRNLKLQQYNETRQAVYTKTSPFNVERSKDATNSVPNFKVFKTPQAPTESGFDISRSLHRDRLMTPTENPEKVVRSKRKASEQKNTSEPPRRQRVENISASHPPVVNVSPSWSKSKHNQPCWCHIYRISTMDGRTNSGNTASCRVNL